MLRSMPRTYVTRDDVTIYDDRFPGPEVCLDHSESDLRLHRGAGVLAAIVATLMLIAIVAMLLS